MGCTDSLRVSSTRLRPLQTVEVCIGARCVLADAAGGITHAALFAPPATIAEVVVVRVRDGGAVTSEQRRRVSVSDFRRNGGGCPPECKLVEVLIDEGGFV